jgi:glycosyltransferase involved in cell wall biosynthesis
MNRMLFSVVTVTLNCVDDAVTTTLSVLAQDFTDYEYFVKDGGSTDGTVERLRELGVQVHVEKDSGIYDAMNQAINFCQGEYVYFLNAGDTLYGKSTLTQFASFMSHKDAIYYGDIFLLPMRQLRRHPARLSRYYLFRKNLNHQAWMARRDLYIAFHGFNLSYRYGADQDFLRRAVLKSGLPAKHVEVVLSNFVYGGYSTCKANRKEIITERRSIIKQYYSPLERMLYGFAGLHYLNPLKRVIWDALHPDYYQ